MDVSFTERKRDGRGKMHIQNEAELENGKRTVALVWFDLDGLGYKAFDRLILCTVHTAYIDGY